MTIWWQSPCSCGSKQFESGKTVFTVKGSTVETELIFNISKSEKVESPSEILLIFCSNCGKEQNR